MDKIIIGDKLRELREERDLSQDMVVKDVNERYGVNLSKGQLSKWERDIGYHRIRSLMAAIEWAFLEDVLCEVTRLLCRLISDAVFAHPLLNVKLTRLVIVLPARLWRLFRQFGCKFFKIYLVCNLAILRFAEDPAHAEWSFLCMSALLR